MSSARRFRYNRRLLTLTLGLIVAASGGPSPAGAQEPPCTKNAAYSSDAGEVKYAYRLCTMPDFDQKRRTNENLKTLGLPNRGRMYCIPTATSNALSYIAAHGFPNMGIALTDEYDWKLLDNYNATTQQIAAVGQAMGIDPADGTVVGDAYFGVKKWLANAGYSSSFAVSNVFRGGSHWPLMRELALRAAEGALVMPHIGWYIQGAFGLSRTGGHMVTLMEAAGKINASGSEQRIGIRDPASDEGEEWGETFQSDFRTDEFEVVDQNVMVDLNKRRVSKIVGYGGIIDGYLAIRPKLGLVGTEDEVVVVTPPPPSSTEADPEPLFTGPAVKRLPVGEQVIDLAVNPVGTQSAYITLHGDYVNYVDPVTELHGPLAPIENPQSVEYGPGGKLLVLGSESLVAIGPGGDRLAETELPAQMDAMAYETEALEGRVLAVSADEHRLFAFDSDLSLLFDTSIPGLVGTLKKDVNLVVDPTDGSLLLHTDGNPQVIRVSLQGEQLRFEEKIHLSKVAGPVGLEVGDDGHLFVSDRGELREFDAQGNAVEASPFAGLPGSAVFDTLPSFTNFDPEIHTGPEWRQVLPEDAEREEIESEGDGG